MTDNTEREELLEAVDTVLRHGRILLGPEVDALESQVAARCNRRYGIGVNSGTDALFLALMSLGIGRGDEVVTTPLSFVATANAIALTGAVPVFADIGEDLNIEPASIPAVLSPKTKAILPVHFTGKVCAIDEIMAIARAHRLFVIEDASQAFGATYRGRPAGSLGDLACFSMNPMKVFAACGEAGMVVTDREDLRDRLVALRYNGLVNREWCTTVSVNGRLDTLQAAILLRRLNRVDGVIERRRAVAACYDTQLAGVSRVLDLPREAPGCTDVYYTYTIRTPKRNELKAFLEAEGIETKVQHRLLMPHHPAHGAHAGPDSPRAESLVKHILSIPNNEKLTPEQIRHVSSSIRSFFQS